MNGYTTNGDAPALHRAPIYFQLREKFFDRIRTGFWAARALLPNEVQLASEFRVSVGTIRRVMDELDDAGLVKRLRGRGTFVADLTDTELNGLDPLRNPDGSRIKWDVPHVEVEIDSPNADEQRAFGSCRERGDVIRLTWLLSRKQRVVAHQRSAVPVFLGIDVSKSRHVTSLAELYARAGILLQRCEDALAFETPERSISLQMNAVNGLPLHKLCRKFYDDKKRIVGLTVIWMSLQTEIYTSSYRLFGTR